MHGNQYHFVTHWDVTGMVEEVSAILGDARDLARWWPAVYLDILELEPGDRSGVGSRYSLFTKGWLPYTLRWQLRVTESNRPYGYAIAAEGDFVGAGIWTFEQDGPVVHITYDWKISAEKPLLRRLSFLIKPVFAANHRWAMRVGEQSLLLELQRRRAHTEAERARIPAPPGPVRISQRLRVPLALAVLLTGASACRRVARRSCQRRTGICAATQAARLLREGRTTPTK